ncbi:hypothetical protein HY988_04210 [Candidatus Micrarchaeota archaeon]|nr:hypothetical protein [Candidatus Micrarchaeota archaeon]
MTDDRIVALTIPTSIIARNWNVGEGGDTSTLPASEIDHYMEIVAKRERGEPSSAHRTTIGNMLVPILVKLGDWQRLQRLAFGGEVPGEVVLYAANGMGAIIQILIASGKEVPKELSDAALAFINKTDRRFDDEKLNEFGRKLAQVYESAELFEPLFNLAKQNQGIRYNNTSRSFALECVLNVICKRLDEKREVPDSVYTIFVNYLVERRDLILPPDEKDERTALAKRFVEKCHEYKLRSVLVRISQSPNMPREIKEQAERLALALVTEKIGLGQAVGGLNITVDRSARPPHIPEPRRSTAKPPPPPEAALRPRLPPPKKG